MTFPDIINGVFESAGGFFIALSVFKLARERVVRGVSLIHVGFFTSEKSKPLVIDKLRANVRQHEIEIYDETTLHEMRSFIVTETGRMEAEKGQHDDCVIALALADHINEGAFTPIVNTDEWYGAIE